MKKEIRLINYLYIIAQKTSEYLKIFFDFFRNINSLILTHIILAVFLLTGFNFINKIKGNPLMIFLAILMDFVSIYILFLSFKNLSKAKYASLKMYVLLLNIFIIIFLILQISCIVIYLVI